MKEYIESFIKENKEFKEPFDRLHECILSGTNKVSSHVVSQTLLIDDSWVEQIQTAILSIEKIVKNPKTFIKTEREVLPADRTKKVDGETIRYLARHTSDINEIDEQGNVKPKRLNSGVTEVETGIYENRVVYALILRLENFVRRTVREVENRINTIDSTTLDVNAQYIVDDRKFDCNIVLRMDKESADKIIVDKNQKLLSTVKDMAKRLKQIKRTQFCKELSTYKKIMPPISKTNLFKMNYDYKNCYECWGLLSANNEIDCRLEVSTAPLPLLNQYFDDISYLVLAATLTFVYNANSQEDVIKSMQGKKKKAVRKFKVVRTVDYQPLVPRTPKGDQEDLINQFYFDKMVDMLKKEGKEEDKPSEDNRIADSQSLSADFNSIFSKVRKINLALYEETLGLAVKEEIKSGTALSRKKALVQREEERAQKYQTILNALRRDLGWEEKKQSTRLKNLEEEKEKLALLQAKEEAIEKEKAEKLAKAQELKRIEEEKAQEKARIKAEKEKAKQEAALKTQREKEAKAKAKEAAEQKAKEQAEKEAARLEKEKLVNLEKERKAKEIDEQLARQREKETAVAVEATQLKTKQEEEQEVKREAEIKAQKEKERKAKEIEEQLARLKAEEAAAAAAAAAAAELKAKQEKEILEKARLEQEKERKDKQAQEIKQENELRASQEAEQKIKAAEQLKAAQEEERAQKAQEEKLAKEQMKLAESEAKKAAALQAKLEKQEFQKKEKEAKASALSEEDFKLEQIRLNEEELAKEQKRLKQIKSEQLSAQKQNGKALSQQEILENHKRYRQLYYEMTLKIKAAEERKEAIKQLKELRERK